MHKKYAQLYQQAECNKETKHKYKCYKYLYARMLKESTIRQAWKNLRKGKTRRRSVKKIDANLDEEIKAMQERIRNTKPEGYEVEHPELAYTPPKIRDTKIVNERGKRRLAHLADIREQWYFHIIVEVLKPIVLRRLYKYSCGSIPGRGPHMGKKYIENVIKAGKNIRYFLKVDIRHFYDSLRISVVIQELRKEIDDDLFLYCIEKIYMYIKKGLLIGLFISPWLANYTLISLDTIITETDGTATVRYMDDITVFANSKKALANLLISMKKELGRLRLKLKRTFQICKFDYETKRTKQMKDGTIVKIRIGRPLDFMGFLFFRDRTVIRKRIMLSATRNARRMKKAKDKGRRYYIKMVRAMVSKMGWFRHTNSYDCYLAYIKPFVNIGKLKEIISRIDKEDNRNEGMENRALLRAAA